MQFGIDNVRQLCNFGEENLRELRNCGDVTVAEIRSKLADHGLVLLTGYGLHGYQCLRRGEAAKRP